MLLFFCFKDKKKPASDFAIGVLNLAWLRRIISIIRLVIQLFAMNGIMVQEQVTMIAVFQIVYFWLLLIAIVPAESDYDSQSWYRLLL